MVDAEGGEEEEGVGRVGCKADGGLHRMGGGGRRGGKRGLKNGG